MRVTTNMAVSNLVNNLDRSYERVARFQRDLSSGTRLNTLSDDPAAVERSLSLRGELRNIEQFQKNLDDGRGWLELSEATLSELEAVFVEARGLAVQGATSTYNQDQRNAIADQVDQLVEHVLSLSEARYRGRYLFAGTQTANVPYVPQRDQNGNILAVGARGNPTGSIEREISDGITMQVNIPGDDIFGTPQVSVDINTVANQVNSQDFATLQGLFGSEITLASLNGVINGPDFGTLSSDTTTVLQDLQRDLVGRTTNPFDILVDLRNSLRDNDPDRVRNTLSGLANVRESVSSVRGLVGARVNRMEITRNVLDRVSVEMTSVLSADEDVDLTETIVNLRQEQDVFQAALASGNMVIQQSLMDFIG